MEIWANTYPSRLELIRKLQEKIVRAISFSDPRDHTRPIFENLSILPIDDLNNETPETLATLETLATRETLTMLGTLAT